ncbi:MAG TPA: hypothetical protein VIW24_29710 [Aldersonia sp.]
MSIQTLTNRGFVVHYLQMLAAMGVGMLVFMPVGMVVDPSGVEAKSLLMATGMTAGMTAWMAYHRHSLAAIGSMALAMYGSFVALFPLYWAGLLSETAVMAVGHVLMLPAMAAAMLWRRDEYIR